MSKEAEAMEAWAAVRPWGKGRPLGCQVALGPITGAVVPPATIVQSLHWDQDVLRAWHMAYTVIEDDDAPYCMCSPIQLWLQFKVDLKPYGNDI